VRPLLGLRARWSPALRAGRPARRRWSGFAARWSGLRGRVSSPNRITCPPRSHQRNNPHPAFRVPCQTAKPQTDTSNLGLRQGLGGLDAASNAWSVGALISAIGSTHVRECRSGVLILLGRPPRPLPGWKHLDQPSGCFRIPEEIGAVTVWGGYQREPSRRLTSFGTGAVCSTRKHPTWPAQERPSRGAARSLTEPRQQPHLLFRTTLSTGVPSSVTSDPPRPQFGRQDRQGSCSLAMDTGRCHRWVPLEINHLLPLRVPVPDR